MLAQMVKEVWDAWEEARGSERERERQREREIERDGTIINVIYH